MSSTPRQLFWCLIILLSSDIFCNYATAVRGGNFDYGNKFNYQVSIQKKKASNQYEHGCGGSIIAEKYILTAAHCFVSKRGQVLDPTNGMRILAGTSNLHNGGIERYIDKVFIPRNYHHEKNLAVDDIAIVQLQNSLFANLTQDQRQNLQIIPLYKSFDYAKLQNQTVVVSGFGITEPNATTASNIRKYLEAKVTKERNCPKLDSIVCVFSQDVGFHGAQGFCHGDSGSPVVIDGKVFGVVSRGAKAHCDMTLKVGKLTLVPRYLDFIEKATDDSLQDKGDVISLPEMIKEAEIIFKPTIISPSVIKSTFN